MFVIFKKSYLEQSIHMLKLIVENKSKIMVADLSNENQNGFRTFEFSDGTTFDLDNPICGVINFWNGQSFKLRKTYDPNDNDPLNVGSINFKKHFWGDWEHHSGNDSFPVPNDIHLGYWLNEYRFKLCEFMIQRFEEILSGKISSYDCDVERNDFSLYTINFKVYIQHD